MNWRQCGRVPHNIYCDDVHTLVALGDYKAAAAMAEWVVHTLNEASASVPERKPYEAPRLRKLSAAEVGSLTIDLGPDNFARGLRAALAIVEHVRGSSVGEREEGAAIEHGIRQLIENAEIAPERAAEGG